MESLNKTRPVEEIDQVFSLIEDIAESININFSPGTYINTALPADNVFLFHSGKLNVYRKYDEKMLFTVTAPFPFGLISSELYMLKCITEVRVTIVKRDDFFIAVHGRNNWLGILKIISYLISVFEAHQRIMSEHSRKYNIVRDCLIMIWNLPEFERMETSIFQFIMSRYNISRSTINNILKALNQGKYIVTKRGILLELNNIPQRF